MEKNKIVEIKSAISTAREKVLALYDIIKDIDPIAGGNGKQHANAFVVTEDVMDGSRCGCVRRVTSTKLADPNRCADSF